MGQGGLEAKTLNVIKNFVQMYFGWTGSKNKISQKIILTPRIISIKTNGQDTMENK